MICSRCGKPLAPGAARCGACGAPGIASLGGVGGLASPRPPGEGFPGQAHAGFWLRAVAYVIDAFVVGVVSMFVTGFAGAAMTFALRSSRSGADAGATAGGAVGLLAGMVITWLYFAIMESSSAQATLGKMALGLVVIDGAGRPIGFGRASGRYFAKLVSAFSLCVGFLLAGFTRRKQALHDLIAGTLVERRREGGIALVVAAVAAAGLAGVLALGVLAAVAIPSFLRYQLRAKAGEAEMQLLGLLSPEASHLRRTHTYFPLALPAGQRPGQARMPWSAADRAAAAQVGWLVPEGTYFSYHVAVAAAPDGRPSYSACAESDLDGDGKVAAVVLWHPARDAAGNVVVPPPPPPCTHDPVLARSPLFERQDPIGAPVKISPDAVF